jgi:hypothetical protein
VTGRQAQQEALALAAEDSLPPETAERFLAELPHLLSDALLRKRQAITAQLDAWAVAVQGAVGGVLQARPLKNGTPPLEPKWLWERYPGWPRDTAAALLTYQQGHRWSEAEKQTYSELPRRAKDRAQKIVDRRLSPRGPHRGHSHTRLQRSVVERVAFLFKALTGEFPGYTRAPGDSALSGPDLRLAKAALDWALAPLPTVREESIVAWLKALRKDGLARAEKRGQWSVRAYPVPVEVAERILGIPGVSTSAAIRIPVDPS